MDDSVERVVPPWILKLWSWEKNLQHPRRIFPTTEARFNVLSALDLSGLSLIEIPKEIFLISNLKNLDLSNNKLCILPLNIKKLTKLKKLTFDKNHHSV